jgi:hypothetical protein
MQNSSIPAEKKGSRGREWDGAAVMVESWPMWRGGNKNLYTSGFCRKERFFRHFFQPLDGAEPFR